MIFFCFLLFWESFNFYKFGTTGPIQGEGGFSAKCTCPNENFNKIENWKCHVWLRLIPLDSITYNVMTGKLVWICREFCYLKFDTRFSTKTQKVDSKDNNTSIICKNQIDQTKDRLWKQSVVNVLTCLMSASNMCRSSCLCPDVITNGDKVVLLLAEAFRSDIKSPCCFDGDFSGTPGFIAAIWTKYRGYMKSDFSCLEIDFVLFLESGRG